jgi:hypothetical protein
MKNLLPFERQMFLAELYHYAWYSDEAFEELKQFISKWENNIEKPIFFNPINETNEQTNTGA